MSIPNCHLLALVSASCLLTISGFSAEPVAWRNAGYNVILTDPSSPAAAKAALESPNIHGFAYAGHAGGEDGKSVGFLVFAGGEGSGTGLDARRFTRYGVNFLWPLAVRLLYARPCLNGTKPNWVGSTAHGK
jgi:hypothetical protein